MENTSITPVTFMLTIAAAISGGLIAAIVTTIVAPRVNEYFAFRAKRRKLLNSALYALLQLYADVRLRDHEGMLKEIRKSWTKGFAPDGFSEAEIDNLWNRIRQADKSSTVHSMTISEFRTHADEQLGKLISSIAVVDPILAFNIRRRHAKINRFPANDEHQTQVTIKTLEDITWQDHRERIERDLRALSSKIGLRCNLRMEIELWSWKRESNKERDHIVAEVFDRDLKPQLLGILEMLRRENEAGVATKKNE